MNIIAQFGHRTHDLTQHLTITRCHSPVVGVSGEAGDKSGQYEGEDDAQCGTAAATIVLGDFELGNADAVEEEAVKSRRQVEVLLAQNESREVAFAVLPRLVQDDLLGLFPGPPAPP